MLNKSSLNAHSEMIQIIQIYALFSKHIMTALKKRTPKNYHKILLYICRITVSLNFKHALTQPLDTNIGFEVPVKVSNLHSELHVIRDFSKMTHTCFDTQCCIVFTLCFRLLLLFIETILVNELISYS